MGRRSASCPFRVSLGPFGARRRAFTGAGPYSRSGRRSPGAGS